MQCCKYQHKSLWHELLRSCSWLTTVNSYWHPVQFSAIFRKCRVASCTWCINLAVLSQMGSRSVLESYELGGMVSCGHYCTMPHFCTKLLCLAGRCGGRCPCCQLCRKRSNLCRESGIPDPLNRKFLDNWHSENFSAKRLWNANALKVKVKHRLGMS